jgi:Putative metallopeptidase
VQDHSQQRYLVMKWRKHNAGMLLAVTTWVVLFGANAGLRGAETHPGRIRVEYLAPEDAKQQSVYNLLRERQSLEQLQRLFSPLRLPIELTLKTAGCEGIANAWYERGSVTLCYKLLDVISQPMPNGTAWAGITQGDAVVGQFLYIAAHEIGHAVFDLLNVPLLGREEDAADQFATYFMLRLGNDQARRLIFGAAYYYKKHLQHPSVTLQLKAFSGEHSTPQQRFYNLLCMAYGANPAMFAEVVDKGYLPKQRAKGCQREYRKVARAFQSLILPHIDPDVASDVLDEAWLGGAPQ